MKSRSADRYRAIVRSGEARRALEGGIYLIALCWTEANEHGRDGLNPSRGLWTPRRYAGEGARLDKRGMTEMARGIVLNLEH